MESSKENIITAKFSEFNIKQRYTGKYKRTPIEDLTNNVNFLECEYYWKQFFDNAENINTNETGTYEDTRYHLITTMFANILKKTIDVYYDFYKDTDKWDNIDGNILSYLDDETKFFKEDITFAQKVKINNDNAKIALIGDIHSSLHSLYDIVNKLREDNFFYKGLFTLNEDKYIFFLGDIVDRGLYSVELLAFVFNLKNLNPNNVFFINGNHEDYAIYSQPLIGKVLDLELKNQFSADLELDIIDLTKKVLYYLPSVIYLTFNNKTYHLSHGAFDPEYCGVTEDKLNIDINKSKLNKFLTSGKTYSIVDTSSAGSSNQFKWGDFYQNKSSYEESGGRDKFGQTITKNYLTAHGIDCIISGHQDMINLGLLINQLEKSNNIDINGKDFILCTKNTSCEAKDYDLYVPNKNFLYSILGESYNPSSTTEKNFNIILKPKTDFLALVTSTANHARKMPFNCYLILQAENIPIGGANDKYYNKYHNKYVAIKNKYLDYKKSIFNLF